MEDGTDGTMDPSYLWALVISGLLTVSACAVSLHEMAMHLRHFCRPEMQVRIVRILGMVPIYSLTSFFSLLSADEDLRLRLDFIRDLYEAFVIYNFISLLIKMGGGWRRTIFYLEEQPRMAHMFPVNLVLPPVQLGQNFLIWARLAALQFVVVKPLGGLLLLMAHDAHGGILTELPISTIVIIANNLTISAALYSLIMLHGALHDLLWKYKPLPKFYAVKAVVFFSFWQGIVLHVMVQLGLIHDVEGFTASDQVTGIQDVLICFEMLLAAVCHTFVFSWREWQTSDEVQYDDIDPETRPLLGKIIKVVDVRDFLTDWRDTVSGDGYEYELRQNEPNFLASKQYF